MNHEIENIYTGHSKPVSLKRNYNHYCITSSHQPNALAESRYQIEIAVRFKLIIMTITIITTISMGDLTERLQVQSNNQDKYTFCKLERYLRKKCLKKEKITKAIHHQTK